MLAATVERIARLFELNAYHVLPVQKGYRNESHPVVLADGSIVNLILYKREPGMLATIQRINTISVFLAKYGFPVRQQIDPRVVAVRFRDQVRYATLNNYLSGNTIPWEAYTRRHLKLLGKTLSDLHASMQTYPIDTLPTVVDAYSEIYRRMQVYFADSTVKRAASEKLNLAVGPNICARELALLRACNRLKQIQPLHMDFVRSNILFEGSGERLAISGILDFEKVAAGHPLFDIARTLAFLLVDCKFKDPATVYKSFLYSGYHRRGARKLPKVTVKLANRATSLLDELMTLFLLHDFYKFLRHNPYESLPSNEHFIRTRDILIARGVISTTDKP